MPATVADAAQYINNATGLTLLFVLLSLVAFWLSTQQSGLLTRLPIWVAGVGLLALAAFQAWQIDGLQKPIETAVKAAQTGDVSQYRGQFGLLVNTLSANIVTTKRYVLPLLLLMIAFGAILGVFAFLALTPGQFLERVFVRPLAIGLLGATVGATLALMVVAMSFGGPVDAPKFVGLGSRDLVHDGDTFWLGDASLRLVGIDAPELAQRCGVQGVPQTPCATESKDKLAELINNRIIICDTTTNADGRRQESFGRPLVTCSVLADGQAPADLGRLMVTAGQAVAYSYKNNAPNPYAADEDVAKANRAGLWSTCTLRPGVWRDDKDAQFAFKSSGTVPADAQAVIGDCSKQPHTPARAS